MNPFIQRILDESLKNLNSQEKPEKESSKKNEYDDLGFLQQSEIKRKDINYLTIIQNHIHLFPQYDYKFFNMFGEQGYVLYKI